MKLLFSWKKLSIFKNKSNIKTFGDSLKNFEKYNLATFALQLSMGNWNVIACIFL